MAKKDFGNALSNSVMGFINVTPTEKITEEKKVPLKQKQIKKSKENKSFEKTEQNFGLTVYTLDQAADIIHVSKRTLFNYIKAGSFPAVKVGKSWLITEEKLREFVETGTE